MVEELQATDTNRLQQVEATAFTGDALFDLYAKESVTDGLLADDLSLQNSQVQRESNSSSYWQNLVGLGAFLAAGGLYVAFRNNAPKNLVTALRANDSSINHAGALKSSDTTLNFSGDILKRLKEVDHFVFDLDRTLIDHDKSFRILQDTMALKVHERLQSLTGEPVNLGKVRSALADTATELGSPFFWKSTHAFKTLEQKLPGFDSQKHFSEISEAAENAYYGALKARPEIVEAVNILKSQGKHVHVFTASSPARTMEKLTGSGLLPHVERIYTSGINHFEDSAMSGLLSPEKLGVSVTRLAENAKPSGDGYKKILADLNVPANKVAMTGDHPLEDIANAKAYGIFTNQAKWFRDSPAKRILPDLEIHTPAQLKDVIQKI